MDKEFSVLQGKKPAEMLLPTRTRPPNREPKRCGKYKFLQRKKPNTLDALKNLLKNMRAFKLLLVIIRVRIMKNTGCSFKATGKDPLQE